MHTAGETFTVPAACTVTIEIRTTGDEASAQIADVMEAVRESVAGGAVSVSVSVVLERPPLRTAPDHPLVRAAVDAIAASSLRAATVTMAPYWTDAALHAAAGTPAIVIGPVGEGLHEDLEWVSTASITDCMRVLTQIARMWCGPATRGE
jgi:acetylornithine deacetylase